MFSQRLTWLRANSCNFALQRACFATGFVPVSPKGGMVITRRAGIPDFAQKETHELYERIYQQDPQRVKLIREKAEYMARFAAT